jgi:formylglycine-generating enzyme required for sulfatase activity
VSSTPVFSDGWGATYRLIEPALFHFGNASSQAHPTECPSHEVNINEPFFLGERLVTQAQWLDVMGTNPAKFQDGWSAGLRPIEQVTMHDIQEFLSVLNDRDSGTVRFGFVGEWRLPSEVEWEYVARAGTVTRWWFGDKDVELDEHAWHAGNSGGQTREVGLKKPNPWGFFDMNGLVSEWCADHWEPNLNQLRSQSPHRTADGRCFVVRGGSWFTESESTRNGARSFADENKSSDGLGFRLVWSPTMTQDVVHGASSSIR